MRQRLVQVMDIERLRALKLGRAERELHLLQQQLGQARRFLREANETESLLKSQFKMRQSNIFKSEIIPVSGYGLRLRMAELSYLEEQVQTQQKVVVELNQQLSSLNQLCDQAEQVFRRCNAQLQAIQLQSSLLRKQLKKTQTRRAETEIEELFVQRMCGSRAVGE